MAEAKANCVDVDAVFVLPFERKWVEEYSLSMTEVTASKLEWLIQTITIILLEMKYWSSLSLTWT